MPKGKTPETPVPLSQRRTIIDSRKPREKDITYISAGASMPSGSRRCKKCNTGYSAFTRVDPKCPACGSKESKPYSVADGVEENKRVSK